MNAPQKISVIVSTYNWPAALAMVLHSLAGQRGRMPDFEVIVADDGSTPETAAIVAHMQTQKRFTLLHAWQPDTGFRLAQSRNNALLLASGDYVIFIDGDCLVPPDFIATHARLAERGKFVAGARSYIKKRASQAIFAQPHKLKMHRFGWFWRALMARANRPFQFLKLPGNWARNRHPDQWQKVQTCNLAVWRADIDRIDGFDNTYVGHGLEDSDFVLRLLRSGLRRKSGRYASVVMHLWHPRPGVVTSPNIGHFNDLLNSDRIAPVSGLGQITAQRAAG